MNEFNLIFFKNGLKKKNRDFKAKQGLDQMLTLSRPNKDVDTRIC